MDTTEACVIEKFKENFSSLPRLFFSPGRINLIGEHVDYNDGFVMPAAIDKGIFYAVAANGTSVVNFIAVDFDEKFSANIHNITKSDNWKNYVISVINEFILAGKNINGFDCVFGGDIPQGSGMSSSAAVEGGLAFAMNEIFSAGFNRVELALLCQRAEHNFPNVQCGIMDQFANMMGKKNNVLLLDCKTMQHQYFPLQLDGYKIVLVNTKVHHSLASGEYNIRRKRCEDGMKILQSLFMVQSFREVNKTQLTEAKNLMKAEVYNCCLFVVEEIERAQNAAAMLQKKDITGFGKLMYLAHEGLSNLYKVSCEELDYLVKFTEKIPAVIGSRMMGGGFGGCTINIVKDEGIENFIAEVTSAYQHQFNILPEAYIVEIADGTREI